MARAVIGTETPHAAFRTAARRISVRLGHRTSNHEQRAAVDPGYSQAQVTILVAATTSAVQT